MSPHENGGDDLAPVVPLFGGSVPAAPPARTDPPETGHDDWHTTWQGAASRPEPRASARAAAPASSEEAPLDVEPESEVDDFAEAAEVRLTRSLASRGLSEREARDRLRREGVEAHAIDDIVDRLLRVGALDDDRLAEQLVHTGVTRKNQGRRAVAQSLAKRGISRESVDAALADLPDDDYERALEYARGKARALARYDRDTGLRRLIGQLSRRGYGGSLAMNVANQALDEETGGARGVRFQ
ncbi:regulatory protein RecX [Microbacterium sp. G2-8]|uniref:regulatory protein RecX n=1 Tax=Microbacterium sp. G2-8 TaxID=2842454 RepID=UPI001C89879F|nr:regulatory protein RecX [Microbacterium sp. G2-8]